MTFTLTLYCTPGRHPGPTVTYPRDRGHLPDGWVSTWARLVDGVWQLDSSSHVGITACDEHRPTEGTRP
jgi:hypothetical protein